MIRTRRDTPSRRGDVTLPHTPLTLANRAVMEDLSGWRSEQLFRKHPTGCPRTGSLDARAIVSKGRWIFPDPGQQKLRTMSDATTATISRDLGWNDTLPIPRRGGGGGDGNHSPYTTSSRT